MQIDPDTGEKIGDSKIHVTEVFIEAQRVYGGDAGLKLYMKYKIMQLIRQLEDSAVYIKKTYFHQHVCFEKKSKRTRKF